MTSGNKVMIGLGIKCRLFARFKGALKSREKVPFLNFGNTGTCVVRTLVRT